MLFLPRDYVHRLFSKSLAYLSLVLHFAIMWLLILFNPSWMSCFSHQANNIPFQWNRYSRGMAFIIQSLIVT